MTDRRRKKEAALFTPRRSKAWRDDPYAGTHRTALDTGREELTPPGRTVDNPANHPRRSDELMTAEAMVNLRLAATGATAVSYATRTDEDGDELDDPVATFTAFGFTVQEARVWQLHLLRFSPESIRMLVPVEKPEACDNGHLSVATVEAYVARARRKVRQAAK